MKTRATWTIAAGLLAITVSAHLAGRATAGRAQRRPVRGPGSKRTPWGDPDLRGEWMSEGEYGVPFERPAQFGTRQFLNDEEYARRLEDI